MPLSPDYISLPVEVLSRVVSYNMDPDISPIKPYHVGNHTFTAHDIYPVHLWSDPTIRACALDTLRAARLVRLEYIGPVHLAPFYHCHLISYKPDVPEVLPYELETTGTLHSAVVTASIAHPDVARSAFIHRLFTLTMKQLAIYIRRMGNYAYVSPPTFLTDIPDDLDGRETRFTVKISAYWRAISPDIQPGNKFVGKHVVERLLFAAFLPLAPLISIDIDENGKARSRVSMSLAAEDVRIACNNLGSNSSETGTTFVEWYSHRVDFFRTDFRATRLLYDRLVRDVIDREDPLVRKMRPWTLIESHNASSLLYQLHADITDPDVDTQGRLLAPILLQGAALISMFWWRHDLVHDFLANRTPYCGWRSCPCSVVSTSNGLMQISLSTLENDTYPRGFGIDLGSWSRVQHQVLLNHRIVRNPSRGDVSRCINDLNRLAFRLWKHIGASWVRNGPFTSDVMDDILTLTDIVKRWKEQEWDDEDEEYDDIEGGQDGSRREYIFSRLSRAKLPYTLNRRRTAESTVVPEKMWLRFR